MSDPNWSSVLPPLLAIALAIVTRQVILSLGIGIWLGFCILNGVNPLTGLAQAVDGVINVFSDAGDVVMSMVGADQAYIDGGLSYFTVDNHITFRDETHAGEAIFVRTQVLRAAGKKLRMYHEMCRASDGGLLATCNQLLIHVSLESRRSCEPGPEVTARLDALQEAQSKLPRPESLPESEWEQR